MVRGGWPAFERGRRAARRRVRGETDLAPLLPDQGDRGARRADRAHAVLPGTLTRPIISVVARNDGSKKVRPRTRAEAGSGCGKELSVSNSNSEADAYASARRFDACSAREAMVETASSLLRLASAITLDALVAKTCAAFCIFRPNSLVWSARVCACRARNSLWHCAS